MAGASRSVTSAPSAASPSFAAASSGTSRLASTITRPPRSMRSGSPASWPSADSADATRPAPAAGVSTRTSQVSPVRRTGQPATSITSTAPPPMERPVASSVRPSAARSVISTVFG